MERQIKFRGKRLKDGKWIYGNLADYSMNVLNTTVERKIIFGNIVSFATDNFGFVVDDCAVTPDTIGQFTGFTDCVTREIYENDILHLEEYGKNYIAVVKWNEEIGAWCIQFNYEPRLGSRPLGEWLKEERFEVIGNIHDNPELISDKQ